MVILSAQDSDKNINSLAPEFFKAFPNIKSLTKATVEMVIPYISKVRGHRKKADPTGAAGGQLIVVRQAAIHHRRGEQGRDRKRIGHHRRREVGQHFADLR